MRHSAIEHLRCPECAGPLALRESRADADDVLEGTLHCQGCDRTFPIEEGIPVLLPKEIPNVAESELRRRVSEQAARQLATWRESYDGHHFRALAELRLERFLDRRPAAPSARVLDIGVGWAVPYLRFAGQLDLWGLDFSFESLVVARRIHESEGVRAPNLVCASLNAIPLGGIEFDLAQSVQVYQHIADRQTVRRSLSTIVADLLAPGGELWLENLNFLSARLLHALSARARLPQLVSTADYELFRYRARDLHELARSMPEVARHTVRYSEVLFQPALRATPRSRRAARADLFLSRAPVAPLLARQVRLELVRRRR